MNPSCFSRNILLILYYVAETHGSDGNKKKGQSSSSNIASSQQKTVEERAIHVLVQELEPTVSGSIVWLKLLRQWNDPQESLTSQELYETHQAIKQRIVSMNGPPNWVELHGPELHRTKPRDRDLKIWSDLCLRIWQKPIHKYVKPKCQPQIFKANYQAKYNKICIESTIYIQDVLACTCFYPAFTDPQVGVPIKGNEDKFFVIRSHESEYFVFKRSNNEKVLLVVGLRNISSTSNTTSDP